MNLSDFIRPTMVWGNLQAKNKIEVIDELSVNISKNHSALKKEEIFDALSRREELGSTGIEDGVAIPHAKINGLTETVVAFGRKKDGLDFQAHDGKLTYLFFVLLAPQKETTVHLKLLARLSRLLKDANFRNLLLNAQDSSDIYKSIIKEDKKN